MEGCRVKWIVVIEAPTGSKVAEFFEREPDAMLGFVTAQEQVELGAANGAALGQIVAYIESGLGKPSTVDVRA